MSNTTEPWQSHTPGPWEISAQNGCLPNEGVVGIVGPVQWNSRGNPMRFYVAQYVDKKNAALIAAIPQIIELLKDFCDSLGDNDCLPTHRQMLAKKAATALLSEVSAVQAERKPNAT